MTIEPPVIAVDHVLSALVGERDPEVAPDVRAVRAQPISGAVTPCGGEPVILAHGR